MKGSQQPAVSITFVTDDPARVDCLVPWLREQQVQAFVLECRGLGTIHGTLVDPPRESWMPPSPIVILADERFDQALANAIVSFRPVYPVLLIILKRGKGKWPSKGDLARLMQTGGKRTVRIGAANDAALLGAVQLIVDGVRAVTPTT